MMFSCRFLLLWTVSTAIKGSAARNDVSDINSHQVLEQMQNEMIQQFDDMINLLRLDYMGQMDRLQTRIDELEAQVVVSRKLSWSHQAPQQYNKKQRRITEASVDSHMIYERLNALEERQNAVEERTTALEQSISEAHAMNSHRQLNDLLGCVSSQSTSKDLIFEGCNVFIQSGSKNNPNSYGNLFLGYRDKDASICSSCLRTGSHNLIIGNHNEYTGNYGIILGDENNLAADYSAVIAGMNNLVTADMSAVGSGCGNEVVRSSSWATGGLCEDTRSGLTCFQDRAELKAAVDAWLANRNTDSEVAQKYGYPINNWCVEDVTDFSFLFAGTVFGASELDNLNGWDVSSAVTMESMFSSATLFNGALDNWVTSNVLTMKNMFAEAYSFNQDIKMWDTAKVQDISGMFRNAISFSIPLKRWSVSQVATMDDFLFGAVKYRHNLCDWGEQLVGVPSASDAFIGTNCPKTRNPSFDKDPPGPFCFKCPV